MEKVEGLQKKKVAQRNWKESVCERERVRDLS